MNVDTVLNPNNGGTRRRPGNDDADPDTVMGIPVDVGENAVEMASLVVALPRRPVHNTLQNGNATATYVEASPVLRPQPNSTTATTASAGEDAISSPTRPPKRVALATMLRRASEDDVEEVPMAIAITNETDTDVAENVRDPNNSSAEEKV